jgi:hypothetical protein
MVFLLLSFIVLNYIGLFIYLLTPENARQNNKIRKQRHNGKANVHCKVPIKVFYLLLTTLFLTLLTIPSHPWVIVEAPQFFP